MKGKILLIFVLLIIIIAVLWTFWPQPKPTVAISKVYEVTQPGQIVEVNITISEVSELFAFYVGLAWDPHIVQVLTGEPGSYFYHWDRQNYSIYQGPFMTSVRPTNFLVKTISNQNGEMELGMGYPGAGDTPSGSGVLLTIKFVSLNTGTTTIEITGISYDYPGQSLVQDSAGEISHHDMNGLITEDEYTPTPIWEGLSFQASTIVIEVVVLAAVSFVMIRKRRVPKGPKSQKIPE